MPGLDDLLLNEHQKGSSRGNLAADILAAMRRSQECRQECMIDLADVAAANITPVRSPLDPAHTKAAQDAAFPSGARSNR
jgi:hypothetical protein